MAPSEYTIPQKKQLVVRDANFLLIVGQLYKMGPNEILRRCVMEEERPLILAEAHEGIIVGHYAGKATVRKVLRVVLPYIEMIKTIPELAMYAKELGNHLDKMKFP
jgi:hypothetical protein